MNTNKDILLEDQYWSSSGSSSVRSEFDDDYYKMRPPPPKLEDYEHKIVVIKANQFSQSSTGIPSLMSLNTTNKNKNDIEQNQNVTVPSSKRKTNKKRPKVFKNSTRIQSNRGRSGVSSAKIRDIINVQGIPNFNNVAASSSKFNTARQNQNVLTHENFQSEPSYANPFAESNINNSDSYQYATSPPSIAKNNTNENSTKVEEHPTSLSRWNDGINKRINQNPAQAEDIFKNRNRSNVHGKPSRGGRRPPVPASNINKNSTEVDQHPTSQSRGNYIQKQRINQNPAQAEDIFKYRIKQYPPQSKNQKPAEDEIIKQYPPQRNAPTSSQMGGHQLYNVPLTIHSTFGNINSSIGRHNNQGRAVQTVSEQPTASTAIQTRQPTISNPVARAEIVTTDSNEKCYHIFCFCFACCK